MEERAGNSSGKAASPQSSPVVRSTLCKVFINDCIIFISILTMSIWSAGLSAELQAVLRMMLAPEPSERPTVSELLSLPSVRKHRWMRRIYLVVAETTLTLLSFCQVVCPC